jgi:hypothetical protein
MTRRLSVAEQAAADLRDKTLADLLATASSWDKAVVAQAILAWIREHDTICANDLRELLPDTAAGVLPGTLRSMCRSRGPLIHTGRYVPSTAPRTKGHPIAVYRQRTAADHQEAA